MAKYIVMTASERMPSNCWGKYGKIAVVELENNFVGIPKMISERAIGVKKIVAIWRKRNIGKTDKCAFNRALSMANYVAKNKNEKEKIKCL